MQWPVACIRPGHANARPATDKLIQRRREYTQEINDVDLPTYRPCLAHLSTPEFCGNNITFVILKQINMFEKMTVFVIIQW